MSKKIRVLFAVPRFSPGGAEKLVVHQLRALDTNRFEPVLITLFDEQKDSLAQQVHIDRNLKFSSTKDFGRLPELYRYIRKGKFDVVVTHLFSANLLVRIAAILARVPVIVSYEHNLYPNKRLWQKVADKILSLFTDLIIVDSEAARLFTATQEWIPLRKFTTLFIPPLLDERSPKDPTELRLQLGIPENAHVILTVSRFVIDKGHRYLVDAAARVRQKFPSAMFVLVGWGPLEKDVKEQVRQLGISANVLFPGRMNIQHMLPIADIYVDSSVSTDLPVAVMEAMRFSLPVVATAVGDISVFVEDGKTGLCVRPKDSDALAQAIEELLGDLHMAARLGEAAKERVEKYSLPAYMRAFEEIIENLYVAAYAR